MTNNGNSKNLKTRLIIVLTVLCLLFSSAFFFVSCKKTKDVTDPTYSDSDSSNDYLISNPYFSLSANKTDDASFPITSPTGWSRAVDNSAASSALSSGVVKLTDDSWKSTIKTLYSDTDFANYIEAKYGVSKDNITSKIKEEKSTDSVTDEEIAEYIIKNYYANPGKHSGDDVDSYVYMLNNYRAKDYYARGTAQKLTSSTTVTMEKGKTYKISVWVKALNVTGAGANIRLTNTFAGVTQGDYRISGIKDTDWTQYAIYVTADKDYACTFTLVLGLGYGNGSTADGKDYTEGTVFFDDIEITGEKDSDNIEVPSSLSSSVSTMAFGKTDAIESKDAVEIEKVKSYAYSMVYTFTKGSNITINVGNAELTKSNIKDNNDSEITSKTYNSDSKVESTTNTAPDTYTYTLTKASATVKIASESFEITGRKYAYVSFYLKNELSPFGSSSITFDVWDIVKGTWDSTTNTFDATNGTKVKRAAVYTTTDTADDSNAQQGFTKIELLIKNNYEDSSTKRQFEIDMIMGPSDVAATNYNSAFATGSVTVKDFYFKTGSIDDEDYSDEKDPSSEYKDGTKNPEYILYNSVFSSTALATQALYASNTADYTEDDDTTSYNFNYTPGDIGAIQSAPTAVSSYYGIVPDHIYMKEDGKADTINTRTGVAGDGNGNYAGVINTKYLSKYASMTDSDNNTYTYLSNIKTALGFEDDEDNYQPIIIYNNSADSYGFIGETQNIAASAYASVTVTLRVYENAKAYIYLVDVNDKNKSVLTFNDFTINSDGIKDISNGEKFVGADHTLSFVVDSSMCTNDGWATVTFYVATGATAKDFRIEVWNGDRTGTNTSKGYVFVKNIETTTSSAFTEPSSCIEAYSTSGNPLYTAQDDLLLSGSEQPVAYKRTLTATEVKFNKEYPDQAVSYSPSYVWARTSTMIYAVYNTVDPVESDPYSNIDNGDDDSGCKAQTDPSAFWISFSTILLAVVLVLAIVALVIKTFKRKHKANKNDAKSQYKVKSRIDTHKANQKKIEKSTEQEETIAKEETQDTTEAEGEELPTTEETTENETTPTKEQNLDAYVYGEVQDFGDAVTNEEPTPVESTTETVQEQTTETETPVPTEPVAEPVQTQPETETVQEQQTTETVKEPAQDTSAEDNKDE